MSNVDSAPAAEGTVVQGSAATRRPRGAAVRLVWSYVALSLGSFGGQALGFVGLAIVTRKIGPHNLGVYGFANSLTGYFSMPLMAGIGMVGIREIATAREARWRTISEVQGVLVLNGLAAYALLFFLAPLISPTPQVQALLRILGLNLIIGGASLDWAMQGLQHLRLLSALRFAGQAVYVVVLLLVMVPGARGATIYSICNLIGAAATSLATILFVWRTIGVAGVRLGMNLATAGRRAVQRVIAGFVPGLGLVMVTIYFSIDIVLLGYLKGDYAVGQYSAAERIPAALTAFSSLWVTVLYPHAAALFHDNPVWLRQQIGKFVTLSGLVVLPWGPVGFLLGGRILTGLFGAAFGPGGMTFGWLICSAGLGLVNANITQLLLACDNERAFLWSVSAGALLNVGLNFVFIPLWGFEGSAVATVAAELVVIGVAVPQLIRLIGPLQLERTRLARAGLPLALTSVLVWGLSTIAPWWVVLAATAVAYPGLLVGSRSVELSELSRLFKMSTEGSGR